MNSQTQIIPNSSTQHSNEVFNQLSNDEQEEVLEQAFHRFPNLSNKTIAVYRYICRKIDEGKDKLSIPAMLIPAMLGMAYIGKDAQKAFKNRFLKLHGVENRDWISYTKKDIFSNGGIVVPPENILEFKVPGSPNAEPISISKSAGNTKEWPFVTPDFARELLMMSTKPVSKDLRKFNSIVHDAVRLMRQRYLAQREEQKRLDNVIRAKRRKIVAEEGRLLMEKTSRMVDQGYEHCEELTPEQKKAYGSICGRINGEINKSLAGKYRGDFAREWGIHPVRRLNLTSRFDEELLSARHVVLKQLDRMIVKKNLNTPQTIMEACKLLLTHYTQMRELYGGGKVYENENMNMSPTRARIVVQEEQHRLENLPQIHQLTN